MGLYNALFFGGLILAIIFLILSVVLFFVLKIPKAFGVVTGQTQRKAIEEIRTGGSAAVVGRKKRSGRINLGNIQARDVDVSEAARTSGLLKKEKTSGLLSRGKKEEEKRSSDASVDLAKKAAEDAKATTIRDRVNAIKALDEEDTEILTYKDMKAQGDSEDTTSVLEMEQATDILTAGDDEYDESADAATDVLTSDAKVHMDDDYDDESTDVLRPNSAVDENEVTDVLRQTSDDDLYDNDLDEDYNPEIDKTDVLTIDDTTLSDDEIYGTYNPEMTAVLRSDMAPGADSLRSATGEELPGITVIYSETIVHTEESL